MFDAQTILQILLVSAVGALIGLDRTAAGQFMISQPIVAGPITGWMLGDATAGLVIGAVLELIWVMDIPIGTFVPADSTIAAVWAAAIAVLGSPGPAPVSALGFSLLLTAGMAPVTMKADGIIRKKNSALADWAGAGPGEDAAKKLARAHGAGLLTFFLKSFAVYLVFLPVGVAAVSWFAGAPGAFHDAMELFVTLLPLLGIASAARRLSVRTLDRFLLAGFLLAAALGQAFGVRALTIIALVTAAGWLGVRYRGR